MYARELQEALDYSHWRSFKEVIEKAMDAYKASANLVNDHFAEAAKWLPKDQLDSVTWLPADILLIDQIRKCMK